MEDITRRINGHAIVTDETTPRRSHRCTACDMAFADDAEIRERRHCPIGTPALPPG